MLIRTMSFHFSGLKDLADFLPASLATIVSYFSAEVTRGVWKPASMNGSDWPSPSVNLSMVEEHIKKIVAATGVDVPRLVTGAHPVTISCHEFCYSQHANFLAESNSDMLQEEVLRVRFHCHWLLS